MLGALTQSSSWVGPPTTWLRESGPQHSHTEGGSVLAFSMIRFARMSSAGVGLTEGSPLSDMGQCLMGWGEASCHLSTLMKYLTIDDSLAAGTAAPRVADWVLAAPVTRVQKGRMQALVLIPDRWLLCMLWGDHHSHSPELSDGKLPLSRIDIIQQSGLESCHASWLCKDTGSIVKGLLISRNKFRVQDRCQKPSQCSGRGRGLSSSPA